MSQLEIMPFTLVELSSIISSGLTKENRLRLHGQLPLSARFECNATAIIVIACDKLVDDPVAAGGKRDGKVRRAKLPPVRS